MDDWLTSDEQHGGKLVSWQNFVLATPAPGADQHVPGLSVTAQPPTELYIER